MFAIYSPRSIKHNFFFTQKNTYSKPISKSNKIFHEKKKKLLYAYNFNIYNTVGMYKPQPIEILETNSARNNSLYTVVHFKPGLLNWRTAVRMQIFSVLNLEFIQAQGSTTDVFLENSGKN